MKAEDWQKVKEIVIAALEMEASGRRAFIEENCAGSPEVLLEVESLLESESESEAEGFLAFPAMVKYAGFFDKPREPEALAGQVIGSYRIIREIGHGGMGAVYLAERADGKFERRVAVKMLKREFNTKDFRRNFNREKEILAALSHPNIALLVDAGTTAEGIPYLVMEYIEGTAIDEFCRENSLSLNERLKLFNRVCEAVAFAHRNLIIHRDLKPSNILVTQDGKPKLLDFGISKLLGAQNPGDEQTLTNLGAMTPEYASPEQIRGETVTTATDIYSLGVILFKLLTETFPYNLKNKTNGNIFREITDTEPSLPSATVSIKNNETMKMISPAQLKGDLDNIILKALSKEPERRYKTIEQFSADIWRFVDGLPVLARPNTLSYRARKFYGRNRASVWAGFLILIGLFAGIAVVLSQANTAQIQAHIAFDAQRQAEIETEKAKFEEAKARAEKEKAEKISRFMAKIISYANPSWYAEGAKFGGKARVIDAMNELGEKIEVEFAGQPDVQAELHHKFSEVYIFAPAETPSQKEFFRQKQKFHALRALELRRQFYGEPHELVAKDLFYAYSFLANDERERAALLMKAIEMMRETNPKNLNLPYMLEAFTSRLMLPDTKESHEFYRQAVAPSSSETNYQIAERFLLESLLLFREHYTEDNHAILGNECKLAYVRMIQNKFAEAAPHYQICKKDEKTLDRNYNSLLRELEKLSKTGGSRLNQKS